MLSLSAKIMVGLVAFIHLYIMILEMFLWKRATRVFAIPKDMRDNKMLRTMLNNQGLYNGFLVAGLLWGLFYPSPEIAFQIQLFFLSCVAVAGLYGAMTAKISILFIQTIPAAIAGVLLIMG